MKKIIPTIFILAIIIFSIYYIFFSKNNILYKTYYVKAFGNSVEYYDEDIKKIDVIKRGEKIKSNLESITNKDKEYIKCIYNKKEIYIDKENISKKSSDLILEKEVFIKTPAVIYKNTDSSEIIYQTKKGDKLDVIGYNKILEDGSVQFYKIKINDIVGYVRGDYISYTKEDSLKYYEEEKYHNYHANMGDSLGAGNAGDLDYYPRVKPKFKNNVMPDKVYALYLNSSHDVISRVDEYIEFAKTTKINAFVVDIKDNEAPGYKSDVMKKYTNSSYEKANNTKEEYKEAIKKLKDNGFYVIGRITVFKDKLYAIDNPQDTIYDNTTSSSFYFSETYWPSPYKRNVWMYNVELASEAVDEMGFNEIQFDYVRFPDRVLNYEKDGVIDYRNDYDETKSQAVQRFLMYASDELHKKNVYVAADVFGESAHKYVTAYGQYYPAISNVVDVISAMPYPDHFNKYEYGFSEAVWTKPYDILKYWASEYAYKRRSEVPTPAIDRSWIQTYDVPSYKQSGGFIYGASEVEAEIKGLFDGGLDGGYMTWNAGSDLNKYKSQASAYSKEY